LLLAYLAFFDGEDHCAGILRITGHSHACAELRWLPMFLNIALNFVFIRAAAERRPGIGNLGIRLLQLVFVITNLLQARLMARLACGTSCVRLQRPAIASLALGFIRLHSHTLAGILRGKDGTQGYRTGRYHFGRHVTYFGRSVALKTYASWQNYGR